MAVTVQLYNHTARLIQNGSLIAGDTYKVELLNNSATFVATHTTKANVDNSGAYEVSGNGWTAGGETLANVAISTVTTNDAMFDADDISKTASGGSIGPAYKAVILNSTDGNIPLAFIDFGAAQTAGVGTAFIIQWSANGIFSLTAA